MSREAFERHAKGLGYSVDPDTRPGREGGYWSSHTHLMWGTWQAAMAAAQAQPAAVKGEAFSSCDVQLAIKQFLDYGEEEFGKSHHGYYSGSGWPARCLRFHLANLVAASETGGRL